VLTTIVVAGEVNEVLDILGIPIRRALRTGE
jgi:hypothetical protein